MRYQIDVQIITDELEEAITTPKGAFLSGDHEVYNIRQRIKDALEDVMGVGYCKCISTCSSPSYNLVYDHFRSYNNTSKLVAV